jgi:hypothetical protein
MPILKNVKKMNHLEYAVGLSLTIMIEKKSSIFILKFGTLGKTLVSLPPALKKW